ncbi:exodeoxyribonuclease VII small subunit [Kordiimonas marina]|uniref:exodeoxyribonuclease VII small subunit n=1 Tax=Kordiimonas marina TaxID=2872312 RepID=UPI001FF5B717|nr:exodeoxyribonuclease VII small subunit [Kordiimonas marina]MCJ9429113.1 exodeoxyribonuclease VII small subunit [Kordiimonas marina]
MSDAKGGAQDLAQMSFEEAMAALEQVVARLESGNASLEQSIELYTRGTALKAHCEAKLKDAQAKIEKITLDETGAAKDTVPFDVE